MLDDLASERSIAEIMAYRAALPLDRRYRTAFFTLEALDSIIVCLRDQDGREGWGEVTILTGYTDETVASGWSFACRQSEALAGLSTRAARRRLSPHIASSPHAVSPFLMALEMLESSESLINDGDYRIALLAPLRADSDEELKDEVGYLLELGYKTLKLKVGSDLTRDIRRLEAVSEGIDGRAKLRVDANQGYRIEDALSFAESLDVGLVEWFEQPCDRKDWVANARVAERVAVPVMLDESVYNFADIQRAAGLDGVDFIKIEMEKVGGCELTVAALDLIQACGMTAVCGNGAASDLSSWFEARAHLSANLQTAGEMHGFRKMLEPLLEPPLQFDGGNLVLPSGYWPGIRRDAVEKLSCATYRTLESRNASDA